jgi:glycosyltransferase involved in cell wall biosynthesis
MIDCLWYESHNRFVQAAKTLLRKVADRSVERYCVWASREIEAYSKAFGLPQNKFVFIPYHTTLDEHDLALSDKGYLFSGGNFARDYPTLIRAVTGLPVTLHIACTNPLLFEGLTIPSNVVIRGYPHGEYLQMMAGCRANIVALAPGLLHSGGQQTFLNSMWMGKPTIVTDPDGASDYIDHGVDGLLVPPGDVEALREAILALISNSARAREMGERARAKVVSGYSTEDHFKKIIALAAELARSNGHAGG